MRKRQASSWRAITSVGATLVTVSLIGMVAIAMRPGVRDLLEDSLDEGGGAGWWSGDQPLPEAPPEVPPQAPPAGSADGAIWATAPGGTAPVGAGTLYRYRVDVEAATGLDAATVASVVDYALSHPRGWINDGLAFQRVDAGPVDMVVRLATPSTVDALCAPLQTNGQVSCRNGSNVVLNQLRWQTGVDAYADDIEGYRIVLVNHEVGHLLGHDHAPCPGPGLPAPIMMQVYYTGLEGCRPNIWPYAENGSYVG